MTAPVRISARDVEFHHRSYFDPNGRVFWRGGELYRVIDPAHEPFVRRLFDDGIVSDLVLRGLLVETEVADFTLDGQLVLRHRTLPYVSVPFEWSSEMLRDAALLTLELERALEARGVMLQDAHSRNIVFDGPKPHFVDFGSLVPVRPGEPWGAADEFRRFFVNPLRLFAAHRDHAARWLGLDDQLGVLNEDALAILGLTKRNPEVSRTAVRLAKERFPRSLKKFARPVVRRVRERRAELRSRSLIQGSALLDSLERQVRELDLSPKPGFWSDYYSHPTQSFPGLEPGPDWNLKRAVVDHILERVAPATVLDFAGNRGWYSLLAVKKGASVVTTDSDDAAIAELYLQARAESLPIQALLVDFRRASLPFGTVRPATERLRSELVLVLALVHHLVFTYRFTFEHIVETFAELATRHLLIEFIPADDIWVRDWNPESKPWYTVENFVSALETEFATIEVLPSTPSPRVLLLCSRA